MYQRILVPLDESKQAEQVIPYARLLRDAIGSRMELIRAIDLANQAPADPAYNSYLEQVASRMQTEAERYLTEFVESLRESGLAISWSVRQGDPVAIIKEQAEREPDTLIAMCSHGRSAQTRWWLGSTTDKICHVTANPLLIVRVKDQSRVTTEATLDTCVVPLDGSVMAERVLPHAVSIARALSLRLVLVQVIPEIDSHFWEIFPDAFEGDRESQAQDYLEGIGQRLKEQGVGDVEIRLLKGHPASTLSEFVRGASDSLVAMMTHGLGSGTQAYRWTMGSVAQRVVGSASGPVLVVRAPDGEMDQD